MRNVSMAQDGNTLTLTIDLAQTFGPSASGKTIIIASTDGNQAAPKDGTIKIGVNVYKSR